MNTTRTWLAHFNIEIDEITNELADKLEQLIRDYLGIETVWITLFEEI